MAISHVLFFKFIYLWFVCVREGVGGLCFCVCVCIFTDREKPCTLKKKETHLTFPFQNLLSIYRLWYVNLWNPTSGKTIRAVLVQSQRIKGRKGTRRGKEREMKRQKRNNVGRRHCYWARVIISEKKILDRLVCFFFLLSFAFTKWFCTPLLNRMLQLLHITAH